MEILTNGAHYSIQSSLIRLGGLTTLRSGFLNGPQKHFYRSSRLNILGNYSKWRATATLKKSPKRLKYDSHDQRKRDSNLKYVTMDNGNIDMSALEELATMIKRGSVGIIPTDTVYSIVCDLKSNSSIERLYRVKDMNQKKPLSILCRSLGDVDHYTFGFPKGGSFGHKNIFRDAKHCLPGPYTFILKASKEMPKRCITFGGSRAARFAPRSSVGVRLPADPVCQALLSLLDEPLLCTSVTAESDEVDLWWIDCEGMAEKYGQPNSQMVDFILDGGPRGSVPSTVVDFTGESPLVLRRGKGPVLEWMLNTEDETKIQGNPYARDMEVMEA